MASQGPNSGGTFADDASTGTNAWTSPGNANASDNVYATSFIFADTVLTHYLKATNFGFSIPSGATINGITVEAEIKASANTAFIFVRDSSIKILKAGTLVGTDHSGGIGSNWPTTDTYTTWGSSSDLWGTTWTDTDINGSGFGVAISAQLVTLGKSGVTASIDHIRITVTYTAGGGGGGGSISRLLTVSD